MLLIIGIVRLRAGPGMMVTILTKIQDTEAKTIIPDILGVTTVARAEASHLTKITQACELMGSVCIISGIFLGIIPDPGPPGS